MESTVFRGSRDLVKEGDTQYGGPEGEATPQRVDEINNWDKETTGLKQKKDNYPTFSMLIQNQFNHGGAKYASSTSNAQKEFTDIICEAFPGDSGVDWVLGTCMKYLGRYKNFGREKDLLKVATYMYILWLKGGFYLNTTHDEDTKKEG